MRFLNQYFKTDLYTDTKAHQPKMTETVPVTGLSEHCLSHTSKYCYKNTKALSLPFELSQDSLTRAPAFSITRRGLIQGSHASTAKTKFNMTKPNAKKLQISF